MFSSEMSGPLSTETPPAEMDSSPKTAKGRGEDGNEAVMEHENGKAGKVDKEREKNEDKDNKAWQQDGDFAYEYVQLAQVRTQLDLHFTIQSITLPGLDAGVWPPKIFRSPISRYWGHMLM
jgi:hypothetical protein